jgi:hypothetical protein
MSHFAEIDANNIVLRVIVADQGFIDSGAVGDPAKWVQTSYNGNMRKNYAGIGYVYDAGRDAFIAPKPYPSWVLDEGTCRWTSPTPYPSEGGPYSWDETTLAWVL